MRYTGKVQKAPGWFVGMQLRQGLETTQIQLFNNLNQIQYEQETILYTLIYLYRKFSGEYKVHFMPLQNQMCFILQFS